ncbi:MAG: glycerophosphodiester phosphodiesterase [Candidatus Lokiarchaeota archaeon]|nr:glycerophosphodiester phosphodiesterase [Candidatus Lokiarchaeota archaeon]
MDKKGDIIVIGHRGANKIAPENTIKSFEKAIALKADFIEFDVHLSKDNRIVVIHDDNTKRTTGTKGKVKNMTLKDLKQLNAGEGEQIPTLEEVIECTTGKINLQIEIKATGMAKYVVRCLESANLINSTLISSFYHDELIHLHSLEPKLKLAPLLFGFKKYKTLNNSIKSNFYAVHLNHKFINKKFIQTAHAHHIKVNAWTVDSKKATRKLNFLGIDGIITNDIEMVLKTVRAND